MPGIQKLHLEDALEDSPQVRSLVEVFEQDALSLRKYSQQLHMYSQRVLNAQREVCAATQSLSQHLKNYDKQNFPLENEDSILSCTLDQFSGYLDELSSVHQILATQLADGMMYPLSKFLQADLDEVMTMCDMFQLATTDHENSLNKYMKLPKKKDNEKLRQESGDELYAMRRKFHQTTLHYFSSLNALQYKRKCSLIEPMLGFIQSQKAFFTMGHETIVKKETDEFLTNIDASVQSVHQELCQETQRTVELIDAIERDCAHMYYADPPPGVPYTPHSPNLSNKAGYLFLRSKPSMLSSSKWDRCYFFTQGGNLMFQSKNEVAGSLMVDLNEQGVHIEAVECEDRRFCFQIIAPMSKKTVILQAENERDQQEWVCTLTNITQQDSGGSPIHRHSIMERTSSISDSKSQNSSTVARVKDLARESPGNSGGSGSPNSTPGGLLLSAPIMFDMISPSDEAKPFEASAKDGPPRRINPFDESSSQLKGESLEDHNSAFCQVFDVRFQGSVEVLTDRGENIVLETIRQIMAARAIHNIFKTTESHLVVSSENMRVLDPANKAVRTEFRLEDISFWATHKDNKRLFGFITRSRATGEGDRTTFTCHVFESNSSSEEICHAIGTATKIAFQNLMERKALDKQKQKAKDLLVSNIEKLDDKLDSPKLSPDGQYVILGTDQSDDLLDSPEPLAPVRQGEGDGDERKKKKVPTATLR